MAMKQRIGTQIKLKVGGESYKAYIPPKLPPRPAIDIEAIYPLLEKSTTALTLLNAISKTIPNTALFIYMYVRKEALLSGQIEGTQSSFSDLMLFEHDQKPNISLEDVEEVSNYVKALHFGLQKLKENFPLSIRLLKDIHKILLAGTRGAHHLPGEIRRSQNWIGGTRPGNALYVPPPVEHLNKCLSDFEKFLHNEELPVLIKAALAHVQFESIHPFLDGNGRLGRLLITLILHSGGILDEPILYLSLYLKQNRQTYYALLQQVRENGRWEVWIEFFLEAVFLSSKDAIQTANKINHLFSQDQIKLSDFGRARFSCEQILEYMKRMPQVTVPLLEKELKMTAPTARSALEKMVKCEILIEITGKKRDRIYVYRNYLTLLESGTEPF